MKKNLFFLLLLLFFPVFLVLSQSAGTAAAAGNAESVDKKEEEAEEEKVSYIEMDIRTSTLLELAAWCRELGLSEGGTKEELAGRLRKYYDLPPRGNTYQPGQQIITIEAAKTTEYFTLEVVDEEYARLKGDVIISLKDGATVHRIKAWEILYNRTRNVMTATGNVEYTKEEGATVETFKGDSITVNLDNWSGIFMDGASQKSTIGRSAAFRFSGTVISKNDEGATVLSGADITNPANEEAYWSLHASKLWLLPGNDWAIFNAVLKVGNIPLLYLPFFFYPADEIIFHPVLGYRSREGTFLQTTTYILGRPKSSGLSGNSITRIFGGDSDSEGKVREGVFLRASNEKTVDTSATQFSVLFDAYVNLGAYLGTELALPAKGLFGNTSISAGLGLTRDIYVSGANYTPFPNFYGESSWNSSRFFFMDVPLRYRFNIRSSFRVKNGSFSFEIPFYSDPYVDRDFMRRTEVLDWLAMLREGVSASGAVIDTSINAYEWKLSGSFSPIVSSLAPYISSFSISNLSSTLLFSQRNSGSYSGPTSPPNPGRAFFFPNRFTILSASAAIAGTPLKTENTNQSQIVVKTEPPPGDALLSDIPISPWGTEQKGETNATYTRVVSDVYDFSPPVLGQRFTLPATGGAQLSVDYRIAPTTATELQFRTSNWRESKDIDLGEASSILSSLRSDAGLSFNLNHTGGGAYSSSLRFSGTGSWQDYLYINMSAEEFSTPKAIKDARDRAYKETYFTSSWDFSTSFRPLLYDSVWSASSLQYSLRGLLAKTSVDTTGNTPVWNWVLGDWNKTDIGAHQVTANLAARIMDYNQNLSVSAVLPPRDSVFSANAVFRAWITETSIRNSISFPLEEDKRKIDPVYFTETLRFTQGSFQQYVVFDPVQNEYTTLTSSLSLSSLGLSASFSAIYSQPYHYNYNGSVDNSRPNGWMQMSYKSLNPNEFKLSYVKTFSQNSLWGNRLSFSLSLNTSLSFDLQRYTNSRFTFSLGVRTRITNFLDLDFSTSSENVVMFKYFQGLPFFNLPTQLYPGQETNLFMDLLNSFRFDNDDLRRQSGFKLKSLRLSFIHHLGDWNVRLSMATTPYLPQGSKTYSFSNDVSFLVQWVPIGEIRTQIDYYKDKLTIK